MVVVVEPADVARAWRTRRSSGAAASEAHAADPAAMATRAGRTARRSDQPDTRPERSQLEGTSRPVRQATAAQTAVFAATIQGMARVSRATPGGMWARTSSS